MDEVVVKGEKTTSIRFKVSHPESYKKSDLTTLSCSSGGLNVPLIGFVLIAAAPYSIVLRELFISLVKFWVDL
jgi:hypothetical protein